MHQTRFVATIATLGSMILAGCAGNQWFRSPSEVDIVQRGDKSANLPSTRFVRWPLTFVADFDLQPEHPLVDQMVGLRDRVSTTLGFTRPEEPIQVFLYSDDDRYETFWKERFPGTPMRRAVFLETPARKALYVHWGDKAAEDVRHEVTHGYLHAMAPSIPLWLDEGLAEYFETPTEAEGKNTAHIELLRRAQRNEGWQPNLKRLERMVDMTQMAQIDYAESWLWTYWLLHGDADRRELLSRYLKAVRFTHEPGSLHMELESRFAYIHDGVNKTLAGL